MTIREQLNVRKKRYMLLFFASIVIIAVDVALSQFGVIIVPPEWLAIAGFVLLGVCASYMQFFALCCPACGNSLSSLSMLSDTNVLRIKSSIRFCPYCGRCIDSEP
jgi:hypothetical protein